MDPWSVLLQALGVGAGGGGAVMLVKVILDDRYRQFKGLFEGYQKALADMGNQIATLRKQADEDREEHEAQIAAIHEAHNREYRALEERHARCEASLARQDRLIEVLYRRAGIVPPEKPV